MDSDSDCVDSSLREFSSGKSSSVYKSNAKVPMHRGIKKVDPFISDHESDKENLNGRVVADDSGSDSDAIPNLHFRKGKVSMHRVDPFISDDESDKENLNGRVLADGSDSDSNSIPTLQFRKGKLPIRKRIKDGLMSNESDKENSKGRDLVDDSDSKCHIPPSDHSDEAEDDEVVPDSEVENKIEQDASEEENMDDFNSPVLISDASSNESFRTPEQTMSKSRRSLKTPLKPSSGSDGPYCSFVDLTQDTVEGSPIGARDSIVGSSVENSPIGAKGPSKMENRTFETIVAELSGVNHDLDANQLILETVSIDDLPDKGKNLRQLIQHLKNQKRMLEEELRLNNEYGAQEAALHSFAPFTNIVKEEVEIIEEDEEENASHQVSPVGKRWPNDLYQDFKEDTEHLAPPMWGDLPKPDMTLSGLGARALQTHFNEKSLTVETLSTLHKALKSCPSEDTYEEDPRGLKVELMPHQRHALAWMLWREKGIPSGGILADDMGLGKTLSMIALILKSYEIDVNSSTSSSDDQDDSPSWLNARYSRLYPGGTLVVCPASVMNQWDKEVSKRTKRGRLSVLLYHGSNRESKPRRLARYDIVLTTYQLLGREGGVDTAKTATLVKSKGPLFFVKWNRIILDEAHMVRNHKSLMSLAVCELVAKHRWCLTGTPIQNKQIDLYALLKFLRCSPFDDLTVWKRWVDNRDPAGLKRLNTMMKSLLLRRTKEQLDAKGELKGLPGKTYETIDVHLDPEELEVYEKIAEYSRTLFAQFLGQRAEKQQLLDARYGFSTLPTWRQGERPDSQFQTTEELAHMHRKMQGLADVKPFEILLLLLRLRQTCCHPYLVTTMVRECDLDSCDGSEKDSENDLVENLNKLTLTNYDETGVDSEFVAEEKKRRAQIMSLDNPVFSLDRPSAKICAVLEILKKKVIGTDDKAIIVSQWPSFLRIISKFLDEEGVKYSTFSGEVPVLKRQDIVDDFNRMGGVAKVLLLSLSAGGVGLNLVGANHLLLVDIHWNPQLEAQACDRIYRFGQKKPVYVYRFITVDSIEENVKKMQDQKLAIAEDVLTGTRNTLTAKLTLDDLKMLFNVGVHQAHKPKV